MALLSGEARSATVVAKTDVECYRLDRASFQELLAARPEIVQEVARIVSARKPDLEHARETYAAIRPEQGNGERPGIVHRIRGFLGLPS
jgi:CRP-like cAMP-binding protein